MRAIDAMILWTPNREPYQDNPLAGTVSVTTTPEAEEMRGHPISVGACDSSWHETDDAGRIHLMQRYFSKMIHRDFLSEEEVYDAISLIDEFNGTRFSSEVPEGESWK